MRQHFIRPFYAGHYIENPCDEDQDEVINAVVGEVIVDNDHVIVVPNVCMHVAPPELYEQPVQDHEEQHEDVSLLSSDINKEASGFIASGSTSFNSSIVSS